MMIIVSELAGLAREWPGKSPVLFLSGRDPSALPANFGLRMGDNPISRVGFIGASE